MGADDKLRNAVEDVEGKVKETVGKVIGDEGTEREGRADQVKSDLKQSGEKVKDAFSE